MPEIWDTPVSEACEEVMNNCSEDIFKKLQDGRQQAEPHEFWAREEALLVLWGEHLENKEDWIYEQDEEIYTYNYFVLLKDKLQKLKEEEENGSQDPRLKKIRREEAGLYEAIIRETWRRASVERERLKEEDEERRWEEEEERRRVDNLLFESDEENQDEGSDKENMPDDEDEVRAEWTYVVNEEQNE